MGKLGVVVHACHLSTWEVNTLGLKSVSPKICKKREQRQTETDMGGGTGKQSQERNSVKQ